MPCAIGEIGIYDPVEEFLFANCCPYCQSPVSGSPILQDGNRVTHGLAGNPAADCGIFAGNRLDAAG